MKNIEKVAASAVKMLKWRDKENCEICGYYSGDRCHRNAMDCQVGMVHWLNKETNTMPELHAGDIIHTTTNQYVAIDDVWVVCTMRQEKVCISDIENYVTYIFRFDSNGNYQEIWRADK